MKTRLFLVTVFLTTILLTTYRQETSSRAAAAPATGTYVSEAEALQALARGGLIPAAGAARVTQRDPSPQFPAAPESLAGKIAFSSNRTSSVHNLYAYDVSAGTMPALQPSDFNAHDVTPVWSPDGTRLLFASDRGGNFDIYLLQMDSSIVTNLTPGSAAQDIHPSWSPDGQHILFSSNRGGGYYQIYRMAADGSNVQQVAVVPGNNALYARYSPDGTKIAFMRASIPIVACDWNWDVWVMNADGSGQVQITSQLGGDFYPNWLPDGSGIIYASCRNFLFSDLYRVNLTTMAETRITSEPWSSQWNGVYSPDGDHIAYNSNKSSPADILIQAVDGVSVREITSLAEDLAPSWYAPSVGSIISGRVIDFAGNPIAGAEVGNGQGGQATTGSDGVYLFTNLVPGTYNLSVSAPTSYIYRPQAGTTITVPPSRYDIDFWAKDADCSGATAYPPVMLITGWGGSVGKMLVEDDQLRYFTNLDNHEGHLTAHGYVPGCNLFYARGTSPRLWLEDNAEIIKEELCRYYDEVDIPGVPWSGEFDLIAYSYGGLRARAYLENINLNATTCEGTTKLIRVGNLFTMGTPHGGELPILPFSVIIGAGALLGGGQWPAFYEMMPPVRLLANLQSAQPPGGICYRLLSGDGRLQAAILPTLLLPVYHKWPAAAALPNDLAVHQWSAHALMLNAWLYPNTTYISTGDLHGQVPDWIDPFHLLESYVNPTRTFTAKILPWLGSDNCSPSPTANKAAPPAQDLVVYMQQPQTIEAAPLQDIAAGLLNSNELTTGMFTITNDGPTSVSLYWFDQELTLTLTDPLGNNITSETSSSDPNIDYTYLNAGFGLMSSFQITNTLTGQWAYTITGQNLQEETLYRLMVLPATPVAVSSSAPEWAPFGRPVVITATVSHGGATPVSGGAVTGIIRRPDGTVDYLVLYDDGQHHDGAANDGIFGAQYTKTNLGGIYGLQLTAAGTYGDEPYTRNATAVFTIAPNTVALTGQYSDAGVDSNGNGLYNWLEVQVGLYVSGASAYTLSAEIYQGATFVTHASNQVYLQPGTQSVPLRFSGDAILASQLDGPYLVRNVILTDNATATVLVETADNVHTTAPYSYDQFGSTTFLYLPMIRRP
jgi:Tol biopolymer transport system component